MAILCVWNSLIIFWWICKNLFPIFLLICLPLAYIQTCSMVESPFHPKFSAMWIILNQQILKILVPTSPSLFSSLSKITSRESFLHPFLTSLTTLWIGGIPLCLIENEGLVVLNLRRNMFSRIRSGNFQGNCNLQTLDLNGNLLEGTIPESVANCEKLVVLNLGNNQIDDIFPY